MVDARAGAREVDHTEGPKMNVVALFRVSTEKQAAEGASLDAQERAYHVMAERQAWATVATFRGHESATQASSDRRVLQQVLTRIRAGGVDAVWILEQSRLTRGDQLEVALLMRELTENGVKVLVNGVLRDPGSIDDSFMLAIQSLVDHTESRRIKERMARGKREKAKQGKRATGPAPYGYRNPRSDERGATRGVLQIVEEEAAVVRRMFRMFAEGTSDYKIAKALNDLGIPSPRGTKWIQTSVRNVLHNPTYVGIQASHVWVAEHPGSRRFHRDYDNPDAVIIPDAHPAIIEQELWDAVRSRPKQPQTPTPRMLTGLLHVNGVRFGGFSVRGRRQYRATDRRAGSAWLDIHEAEDAVWDAFARLATSEEIVRGLLERAETPNGRRIAEMEIEHLEDQLGRHGRRLDRLTDMRADGEIDKEDFLRRRMTETATIDRLQRELVEQRAKVLTLDGTHAVRIVRAVQTILAGRTRLTTAQKRRVLTSLVTRIDVEAERVTRPIDRNEEGEFQPGQYAGWEIRKVEFRLALPPDEAGGGVPREQRGPRAPASDGATWGVEGDCDPRALIRGCQLNKTPSGIVHVAITVPAV